MAKFLRGQYQILEQVILFGIGLIILTSVFSIFSLLGDRINLVSVHNNFQEVGLAVASNLIEVYGQGKYFHNASITLALPRVVGNRLYQISINDNGVHINATDNDAYRASIGVYNINRTAGSLSGVELSAASPIRLVFYNSTREATLRR
ncbi:MAG: hypothetical protein HY051_00165 [Candidatus Aenigmarchaeota archaeon]|nr:hypothetical protein [Candidatus Aenigmarchaeota archaeon]